MENARDDGWRGMEVLEVCFEDFELGGARGRCGPEEGVVVREEGKEDAEKEGRCCCGASVLVGGDVLYWVLWRRWRGLRQRMRKVAKADC